MKTSLYKLVAAAGFSALAMNAAADQGPGSMQMDKGSMGGMKMDCSKDMPNMKGMKMDCMEASSKKAVTMSEGEVIAVDKANKRITLKHGPIENMQMQPMTMAFKVKAPSMLSRVKVGDKVKFKLENVNHIATVTALNVQK